MTASVNDSRYLATANEDRFAKREIGDNTQTRVRYREP
jgi:hypothetical protein